MKPKKKMAAVRNASRQLLFVEGVAALHECAKHFINGDFSASGEAEAVFR